VSDNPQLSFQQQGFVLQLKIFFDGFGIILSFWGS
jgi:hypothetical protein